MSLTMKQYLGIAAIILIVILQFDSVMEWQVLTGKSGHADRFSLLEARLIDQKKHFHFLQNITDAGIQSQLRAIEKKIEDDRLHMSKQIKNLTEQITAIGRSARSPVKQTGKYGLAQWVYDFHLEDLFGEYHAPTDEWLKLHEKSPRDNGQDFDFNPGGVRSLFFTKDLRPEDSVMAVEERWNKWDERRWPKPHVLDWNDFCARANILGLSTPDQHGRTRSNFEWWCIDRRPNPTPQYDTSTPSLVLQHGYVENHPNIMDVVAGFAFNFDRIIHVQIWIAGPHWASAPLTPQFDSNRVIHHYDDLITSTGTSYPGAWGHYPVQAFPLLLRMIAVAPSTAKILVNCQDPCQKLTQVLIDAGLLDKSRIIQWPGESDPQGRKVINYGRRLWFADGETHIRSSLLLVERVMKKVVLPDCTFERKYIVLIHRTASRKISNEDEVIKAIEETGEKVVLFKPDGTTIAEDMTLFAYAKAVVAPHGAGLFNVLWTPKHTPVLEFGFTTGMPFPDEYFHVTAGSDRPYYCMICNGDYSGPMTCDINNFKILFGQMLAQAKEIQAEAEQEVNPFHK